MAAMADDVGTVWVKRAGLLFLFHHWTNMGTFVNQLLYRVFSQALGSDPGMIPSLVTQVIN